jgi:two-component system cell cycle sensor histidine kinase/response regulator CckA
MSAKYASALRMTGYEECRFAAGLPHRSEIRAEKETPEAMTQDSPSPTLMMIDDEPLMTDMFRQAMTKRHFQTLVASSGVEALQIVAAQGASIDLIITDMTMPDMDGLDVARELYARVPHIPVLIATGHNLDPTQLDLPPNVVEIIRKPYQMRALAERLREILENKVRG